MGIPNIEESIWTKYKKVVETNKEKRKYTDGWHENEPPEIIYDKTCENETDEEGNPIHFPWEFTNLLSGLWVQDLFGDDFFMVNTLLKAKEAEIVFVNNNLYYREMYVRDVLQILQTLAKSKIVNILRPMPQLVSGIVSPVYTSKDLMNILDVKDSTLRKYRDNGDLEYCKFGDKIWYTQEHLNNFLHKTDIRYKKRET